MRPSVSHPLGPYVVSVRPRFSYGAWLTDALEGDLRVAGGDLEAQRWFGGVRALVSAGVANVENGTMEGTVAHVEGGLLIDHGGWNTAVTVQAQRNPIVEDEVGGGLRLSLTLAPGMQLHAYAGRRLRDALFGTAGSFGFSVSATVRAVRWSSPGPPPVAAIGQAQDSGRVVEFAIRAPEAESVAVTGDFTGWEPVAMEPGRDGWWQVRRVLEPGLHHFGFLVDDQWAIPPRAPGVVEDGWGRRNASIVVEL